MPIYSSGKPQNLYTSPSRKHMVAFQNFGGGMNSVSANDNLADSEFPVMVNAHVDPRGSVSRRTGFVRHFTPPVEGKGQGYFRYYDGSEFKEIFAVNGKLYNALGEEIPIEGLPGGFQKDRLIEAVQFGDILYIATGTKLVQYDGTTAKVVEPYRPQALEALYIGTNALADNPNDFMTDGVAVYPRLDGVTLDKRYGVVGQPLTVKAFVSKPETMTLEYKFERRMSTDKEGFWFLSQDWSESKEHTFVTSYDGDMEIKVSIRDKNDPTKTEETYDEDGNPQTITVDKVLDEYYVPKFVVKPVEDPKDKPIDHLTIHQCNRILLHWNRLILYGDPEKPDVVYISHLNRGDYFPMPNSLQFVNGKQEGITKIVQYRDMLVVFTPTTIQALFGTNPMDYQRVILNTDIGAVAPESVRVLKNYIIFLAKEGVHVLKTVGQVNDKANVEKIDGAIGNRIAEALSFSTDAAGVVYGDQYHLVFSGYGAGFRYYYELGIWVADQSSELNFSTFYVYDSFLYAQNRENGKVVRYDGGTYLDDGQMYPFIVQSKFFDFGLPYHPKKLKEVQVLMKKDDSDNTPTILINTDDDTIFNRPPENVTIKTINEAKVMDLKNNDTGKVIYENINGAIYKWRLSGKTRQVQLTIMQAYNEEIVVYGFGFIFKVKSP